MDDRRTYRRCTICIFENRTIECSVYMEPSVPRIKKRKSTAAVDAVELHRKVVGRSAERDKRDTETRGLALLYGNAVKLNVGGRARDE